MSTSFFDSSSKTSTSEAQPQQETRRQTLRSARALTVLALPEVRDSILCAIQEQVTRAVTSCPNGEVARRSEHTIDVPVISGQPQDIGSFTMSVILLPIGQSHEEMFATLGHRHHECRLHEWLNGVERDAGVDKVYVDIRDEKFDFTVTLNPHQAKYLSAWMKIDDKVFASELAEALYTTFGSARACHVVESDKKVHSIVDILARSIWIAKWAKLINETNRKSVVQRITTLATTIYD